MKAGIDLKLIVGQMVFENLETGFWALMDGKTKYRIKNIPDELKQEKLKIAAIVKEIEGEMSIFMSGVSVELIEYKLIK